MIFFGQEGNILLFTLLSARQKHIEEVMELYGEGYMNLCGAQTPRASTLF